MEKVQYFFTGIFVLLFGTFNILNSKRFASIMVKSSNMLREALNIKGELGRVAEIFVQIFLIVLGIAFILVGIRLLFQIFVK